MAGHRLLALLASLVSSISAAESGRIGSPVADKKLELDKYLAKVRDWTPRRDEGELPIGLTEEEKEAMKAMKNGRPPEFLGTDPPTNPIFVPEWAPMRGVLIRYPFGLTTELINAMSDSATIYCLVASSQKNSAEAALSGAGVDPSTVEWIEGPTDSYWTRDYGPWFVYTDDASAVGGLAIVNHVYNRPRPNDDQAPLKVANHIGVPWFDAGIVGTGGNMMVDGLGQAAAAHIIYTENESCGTSDETSVPLEACGSIDTAMYDYFGVGIFHVVADPNNEYIDHIDCWAKYLSPTTVLVREVSMNHPQYDEIEEVATYLRDVATTSDGEPWNMVRIWTDSDQPYTNSLILNNKVFVPIVGSAFDDAAALQVYQDSMPGYTVTGWQGTWQSTDALHCRARGIPEALNDCGNGVCAAEETCLSCAADCVTTSEGAVCGNGICEAGNGEDCLSCPGDCHGQQGGRPNRRFCCGDGDGQYPVSCSDSRCGDPSTCTDVPAQAATTCCGDGTCEGEETFSTCARDCGNPCGDGTCDTAAGEDSMNCPEDCSGPQPCKPNGDTCMDKSECCSNRCDNKGRDPTFECVAK